MKLPSGGLAALLAEMKWPLRIGFAVLWISLGVQIVCRAQPAATNLWTFPLQDRFADSSPALAPDGTIYQATFNGRLFAVTPEGKLKWAFQAGREIKSSPAITDDGTIYFGSRDWKFYAVTPQGKLKWAFPTGAWVDSSPAIGADGTIYFGSWDTNFYALNPNGTKKWSFPTGDVIDSSPAIGADGTIYFGSHDKKLYALKPNGTKKWDFNTGGQIGSSPAIGADGTIYFTSTDGNLYALRPDGTERWRVHTGGETESSPVLDEAGNIYVSVSGCLYIFSKDGEKGWWWCGALPANQTAAIAADGLVYFPAAWRRLAALKRDGSEDWQVGFTDNVANSPVIGGDGTVYFSTGTLLVAVNSINRLAPLAKSPWPMFRANPRHTGRVSDSSKS
jgi:outer membrane protein assembly factor BamB